MPRTKKTESAKAQPTNDSDHETRETPRDTAHSTPRTETTEQHSTANNTTTMTMANGTTFEYEAARKISDTLKDYDVNTLLKVLMIRGMDSQNSALYGKSRRLLSQLNFTERVLHHHTGNNNQDNPVQDHDQERAPRRFFGNHRGGGGERRFNPRFNNNGRYRDNADADDGGGDVDGGGGDTDVGRDNRLPDNRYNNRYMGGNTRHMNNGTRGGMGGGRQQYHQQPHIY